MSNLVVGSDIYPAVRRFLEENELQKCLKAFDKESGDVDVEVKSKKAKALAEFELVAACQLWLDARQPVNGEAKKKKRTVEASDVCPAMRRFLLESGLQKCLKAFDKDTGSGDDAEEVTSKKAKALAELELVAACQLWLDARLPAAGVNGEAPEKKKKKRKAEAEEVAPAAAEEEEEEKPQKKKGKKAEAEEEDKEEKPKGERFQRIDPEKWSKSITDPRLRDNTHKAKEKFGDSAGDTWADKASVDLGLVKGKGFRKEMAKKKRASWRGGGEIDQGINSIKFSESEDED